MNQVLQHQIRIRTHCLPCFCPFSAERIFNTAQAQRKEKRAGQPSCIFLCVKFFVDFTAWIWGFWLTVVVLRDQSLGSWFWVVAGALSRVPEGPSVRQTGLFCGRRRVTPLWRRRHSLTTEGFRRCDKQPSTHPKERLRDTKFLKLPSLFLLLKK